MKNKSLKIFFVSILALTIILSALPLLNAQKFETIRKQEDPIVANLSLARLNLYQEDMEDGRYRIKCDITGAEYTMDHKYEYQVNIIVEDLNTGKEKRSTATLKKHKGIFDPGWDTRTRWELFKDQMFLPVTLGIGNALQIRSRMANKGQSFGEAINPMADFWPTTKGAYLIIGPEVEKANIVCNYYYKKPGRAQVFEGPVYILTTSFTKTLTGPVELWQEPKQGDKVAAELQKIETKLIDIRVYKKMAGDIGRPDLIPRVKALEKKLEEYKTELETNGESALASDAGITSQAIAITGYFSWKEYDDEEEAIKKEMSGTGKGRGLEPPRTTTPPKPEPESNCVKNGLGFCTLEENCKPPERIWKLSSDKDDCPPKFINSGMTRVEQVCCAENKDIECSRVMGDSSYECTDVSGWESKMVTNYCPERGRATCPGDLRCCKPPTCGSEGGIVVKTRPEEIEKCKQPTKSVFKIEEGICCEPKEAEREAPKKVGTLGRLSVCVGKYWLWGKENDITFLEAAKKSLSEVTGVSGLPTINVEQFKTLTPEQKKEQTDKWKEQLFNKRKEILDDEKLKDQAEKIAEAEDSLEKTGMIHAMTWSEISSNIISCALGAYKAGRLAFQGGERSMGKCSAEMPLPGTEACLSCNKDPYRICTKERCAILGTCIAVPTEKGDQYNCIPGECEELGLVGMEDGIIEWYINGEMAPESPKQADISQGNIRTDIGEIPFNTKMIIVNLTTDKPAQCRWILDERGAEFENMEEFEDNYYPMLPGGIPGWQYAGIMLPGDVARDEEHRIFIKCNNACNIAHGASYDQNYIEFKLAKKPDQLPPIIVHIDPPNHAVINGDWKNLTVSFWLDELGNCKYSDKSMNYTITYEEMKYFNEKPNENSSVIFGRCYPDECIHLTGAQCTHCELELDLSKGYEELNWTEMPPEMQEQLEESLSNITKLFNFMIRCEDTAHNIMIEDDTLDYIFMTMPGYNISVIRPEMDERTYDRQPEIEVTSEPRVTECKYKTYQGHGPKTPPAWDEMYYIDEYMDIVHYGKHNETLNATKTGMLHTLWARCSDKWAIEAINFTKFYTILDEDSPIIIRMYHDTTVGDYLLIETDENSTCVYGTSSSIACNYNFTEGTTMTGNNETIHATYWQLDHLYYIKCVDEWENYPGRAPEANACTAIINPYEVPPL